MLLLHSGFHSSSNGKCRKAFRELAGWNWTLFRRLLNLELDMLHAGVAPFMLVAKVVGAQQNSKLLHRNDIQRYLQSLDTAREFEINCGSATNAEQIFGSNYLACLSNVNPSEKFSCKNRKTRNYNVSTIRSTKST